MLSGFMQKINVLFQENNRTIQTIGELKNVIKEMLLLLEYSEQYEKNKRFLVSCPMDPQQLQLSMMQYEDEGGVTNILSIKVPNLSQKKRYDIMIGADSSNEIRSIREFFGVRKEVWEKPLPQQDGLWYSISSSVSAESETMLFDADVLLNRVLPKLVVLQAQSAPRARRASESGMFAGSAAVAAAAASASEPPVYSSVATAAGVVASALNGPP